MAVDGDAVREDLLDRAAQAAPHHGRGWASAAELRSFLAGYYRHVPTEDVVDREPVDVYGAAMSHYRLAGKRLPGVAAVHVFTPTVEEHGWSCGHTVVEVVTDDMPFLVDSVTLALSRQDRAIHLVVHPQFTVHRDITGRLVDVRSSPAETDDAAAAGVQTLRESWIHVEIGRETEAAEVAEIDAGLRRVLSDVREAIEDWPKMRARARAIVDELAATPPPLPADEVAEARALLGWLADDHFTFIGYREYELHGGPGEEVLRPVAGTGLGVLRPDYPLSRSFAKLPPEVRRRARERTLLVLTKANSRSTVHRSGYLDYVGVKVYDEAGEIVGERRFLGLLTSVAYTTSVEQIPVIRRVVAEVLRRSGFAADAHSGKALLEILETYPRDELFHISVDELLPTVLAVLHLQERRQLRLFVHSDVYDRYVSCLVYLPRDHYTTSSRLKMQDILVRAYGAASIDFNLRLTESVLARLHFVLRMPAGSGIPAVDVRELEHRLAASTRNWNDDFTAALVEQAGEEQAIRLARQYGGAFPEAYKEQFGPRVAVADIRRLEALPDDGLDLSLYEPVDAGPGERRFKIYRRGAAISLSTVLPLLARLGVEVTDEHPYQILTRAQTPYWIYDLGLRYDVAAVDEGAEETVHALVQDAFAAVWRGRAESDGFNRLVLAAGLSWRQVSVLRAYARYLRQIGTMFSESYISDALVANPDVARALVELFQASFDPDAAPAGGRDAEAERQAARVEQLLADVASLDHDRIIRSFLTLVRCTLRTNYFQVGPDGGPKEYLSVKFDAQANPDVPLPRPRFGVWVYSPRVEGIHLRFGPVARGGLRWSDRREDFRTEVLGLVKAQMVKNAVIVPVGAKGGFYCKRLPDPAAGRDAWLAEGIACYRTFICGLLDITDNLKARVVVHPPRVVCHDGDDPYLVVAADKGTASFSDIANSVAADYGYWLGDAFASGGSAGYDHKEMGITARGAWVSVERHFREMGIDCQQHDFTCTGIGDMSGDVFGNGLLRSAHTRLLAAFDHRHVFLDPDPDAAASFRERQRLYALPRSSWADYDPTLISAGGGVYPRTAKTVPVSPQVRAALGIAADVTALTPAEVIRAILLAPVDLLWNGGIGTYVKASTETDAAAGDKANDAVRVNGGELRCRCVGEGGNLGFTQLGRIEYATGGGRINTDFIDNSAGVDTSDHEVNIKILLNHVVDEGDLTEKQRNHLLHSMTDEVAELVLADNYAQNAAIACEVAQSASLLHVHADWIRRLEKAGELNRAIEFLPSDRQLAERRSRGQGLTAPEIAVLLTYTKIVLAREMLATALPEDPYLHQQLVDYFPHPMRRKYHGQMAQHRLARDIVTTQLVNGLVNRTGVTCYHRLSLETGAAIDDLTRAHVASRAIFQLDPLWADVAALDGVVPAAAQTSMRLQARTVGERSARWLVTNRRPPLDIAAAIEHFGEPVGKLMQALPDVLRGRDLDVFVARRDELTGAGVPADLATRVAVLPPAYAALGIADTVTRTGEDLLDVARVHATVGEWLGLDLLLERILALPREDRWQTMARAALRDDLHGIHTTLTEAVLTSTSAGRSEVDRVAAWAAAGGVVVDRAHTMLRELADSGAGDLARMSVGVRAVRSLLPAG